MILMKIASLYRVPVHQLKALNMRKVTLISRIFLQRSRDLHPLAKKTTFFVISEKSIPITKLPELVERKALLVRKKKKMKTKKKRKMKKRLKNLLIKKYFLDLNPPLLFSKKNPNLLSWKSIKKLLPKLKPLSKSSHLNYSLNSTVDLKLAALLN